MWPIGAYKPAKGPQNVAHMHYKVLEIVQNGLATDGPKNPLIAYKSTKMSSKWANSTLIALLRILSEIVIFAPKEPK